MNGLFDICLDTEQYLNSFLAKIPSCIGLKIVEIKKYQYPAIPNTFFPHFSRLYAALVLSK